jgi:Spy/CpxP family protein refolding chaperone
MKPIPRFLSRPSSRMLAAAATVLAVTFGAAYAAADAPPPGGPGEWHHHGGHGGFMTGHALDALHSELKLSASQEQQWQSALDTMKRDREAEHANREQAHKQIDALRQQPILDLNALHAAMQQTERQNAQLHEEAMTAWLNVYNGLTDSQKKLVSDQLKQHFAKMDAWRERMHERGSRRQGAEQTPPAQPQ